MRKPDAGVNMLVEYNKHLRSRTKNGSKRGSMSREYWREWRAKAKQALRREVRNLEDE
jgi:hypothetical protein